MPSQSVQSPYLTSEEAAMFCRVSDRTFRAYVRKYRIPRHGPGHNKYLEADLRDFMADSGCFVPRSRPMPRRENRKYVPVRV